MKWRNLLPRRSIWWIGAPVALMIVASVPTTTMGAQRVVLGEHFIQTG